MSDFSNCIKLLFFANIHSNYVFQIILQQENAAKILHKTYQQCERKQKMLSKMRNTNNLPLPPIRKPLVAKNTTRQRNIGLKRSQKDVSTILYPALKPDCGIINKNRPRAFQNSMIAIKCLLNKLNIENIKEQVPAYQHML